MICFVNQIFTRLNILNRFKNVVQKEYFRTTFETRFNNIIIGMKGLSIVKRTSKQEGTIRLRFRLREVEVVDSTCNTLPKKDAVLSRIFHFIRLNKL